MNDSQRERLKLVISLGHRRKRTTPWQGVGFGLRAWRSKKPMLCLNDVTDADGLPLENEDESGRRLSECWGTIFQARVEGEMHRLHEAILRCVQQAPADTRWEIDRNELDELMATQKESAPGPDGIPCSFYRCAGKLGSQVLFNAYKHVLEGGAVPALFAESRTVFIPKSSDDNSGRIVRSPEALRPLILCITNMKISCDMFRKHLTTCAGLSIETSLMNSWFQKRNPLWALVGFNVAFTDVREAWVLNFSTTRTNMCLRVALFLRKLLRAQVCSSPSPPILTTTAILWSPDALRPLTLCKILTSAICRGLQWYTMRCIHPTQRCVSSRQMTDNIFEIETAALAHVACAPRESGILLTDFAAAYPGVNHPWIFSVLEKTELP